MATSRRTGRPPGRPRYEGLSPAEERVLEGVRRGMTNPEIGDMLGISTDAVKYHVSNMLGKLDLADRHALAAWEGDVRDSRSRMWWWVFAFLSVAAALGVMAWWLTRPRDVGDDRASTASVTATVSPAGSPAATPTTAPAIAHPQGGDEVILRYWTTNGFPIQELGTDQLVLFGNGRLLHRRRWGPVGEGWQEIWLNEAGIQRLIDAIWQGGTVSQALQVPPSRASCADCGEPNIELHLNGQDFRCEQCIPSNRADLQKIQTMTALLQELDQRWFAPDEMVAWGPYAPDALEVDFGTRPESVEPNTQGLPPAVAGVIGAGRKTLCGSQAREVRSWLMTQPSPALQLGGVNYRLLARPLSPLDPTWSQCGLSADQSYVAAPPAPVDLDALPDGAADLLLSVRRQPPTLDPARGLELYSSIRVYGDDRVILGGPDHESSLGFRVLQLTRAGVQRLLSLATASVDGETGDGCLDCPGDHFVIALPDGAVQVDLAPPPRVSGPDYRLPALQSFANLLWDAEALLGPGELLDDSEYRAGSIVVQAAPRRGDPRPLVAWPFSDLALEALTKPTLLCGETATRVKAFLDSVPKKWRGIGTDTAWLVRYRYAFPDEVLACQ